jgi:uncharacterized membrane protein YfcA
LALTEITILISCGIAVVAFLYSSVGHAGASGYIAVMTLFGVAVPEIKPMALMLNILVASITAWQFWRAGYFSMKLFLPFAILSVPLAFLGGFLNLPLALLKPVIGIVLLLSAARFVYDPREAENTRPPATATAFMTGAAIGLLSGFTGTGGGIFLSPLMLLAQWARTKTVAAVSAMFILVNSVAGLAGNFTATRKLPADIWIYLGCVLAGGAAGSYLGSQRFSVLWVKRLLALVLTIAGLKLILS